MKTFPSNYLESKNYFLTSKLGHGAHGIVYRGYHKDDPDKMLAIKIINNIDNRESRLIEPEILSRLQHPNIVAQKDYFLHEDNVVLVMDYIEGIDLQTYLEKKGKFDPSEIKNFLFQVGSALSHAHNHNIIHRDLKLSNILITEGEQYNKYTVVDFGVSRIVESIQISKSVAGTYHFMAPEQLRGRASKESDLWALGVITYMLLTKVRPFEGNTLKELSRNIFYQIPPYPSDILGKEIEYIFTLEKIIFQLLEKQIVDRISADELLQEIEKINLPTIPQIQLIEEEKKPTRQVSTPTWERNTVKEIKKYWISFWISFFLGMLPVGLIGSLIALGGIFMFYIGNEKHRPIMTVMGGFVIMPIGLLLNMYILIEIIYLASNIPGATRIGLHVNLNDTSFFVKFIFILLLVMNYIALHLMMYNIIKIRFLNRKLKLMQGFRFSKNKTEELVELLQKFVDQNHADMYLHQKYVEILLILKRTKEAIVESKLMLEMDPYNKESGLLLVHGYFNLGLYTECMNVCDRYLSISGYNFEFSDFRDRCQELIKNLN
jgi:serine/threonine protein kinase